MNKDKNLTIEQIFKLALENQQKNNFDVAIKLYNQVLEINPFDVSSYYNLGLIFNDSNNYEKAINCYNKVITIDPDYLNAHINLGAIFFNSKEYQKAISHYEKIIEIDPKHESAHNNLGAIFKSLKEYNKAISYFKKVLEINPNSKISLYNLGVVLYSNKQYKDATELFKLSNFKKSKNFLLNCLYKLDDKFSFFEELDNQIKQGKVNAVIGSLTHCSEIKYGVKKLNPFCQDPLKYVLKTNLTEQYDFENIFVKPITNLLKENSFLSREQNLLTNGQQSAGDLFFKGNDSLKKIKDIIHLEISKYRNHFKDSKEGFIRYWPKSYEAKGWLISMKSGGKLSPHIHGDGWLSGSIYINVPPKSKIGSGNLVVCLHDNELASNQKKNKNNIDVITGSLCLFPASLHHYTIPFESKEDRIVLAFDVTPSHS